jgi:hypothetical protein
VRVLCRIDSLETSCLLGLPLLLFSVFFFHFSFGLAELTHVMPLTKALLSPRSRFIFFFFTLLGAVSGGFAYLLARMQAITFFFQSMSVFYVSMSELKPAGHTAELKHVVRY